MMLYDEDRSYERRAADFDARHAAATALKAGAVDMGALANGEPQPSDVMMLHDPVVSPDLRAAIIDARKRMWMKSPTDRLAYRDAISPLADAIQNLIDEHGFKYTPLMRLISPKGMPNKLSDAVIENHQVEAKLAKFDAHACDLNYLVDPRIAPSLRRRIIETKKALDAAPRERRRTLSKMIGSSLIQQVEGLRSVVGNDGVAAILRVLDRD